HRVASRVAGRRTGQQQQQQQRHDESPCVRLPGPLLSHHGTSLESTVLPAGLLRLTHLDQPRMTHVPPSQPENGEGSATPAMPPCKGGIAAKVSHWSLPIVRHGAST